MGGEGASTEYLAQHPEKITILLQVSRNDSKFNPDLSSHHISIDHILR